jgi:hypothetical protein
VILRATSILRGQKKNKMMICSITLSIYAVDAAMSWMSNATHHSFVPQN